MRNKNLKELANINFCTITPSRSKPSETSTKWLLCSNFLIDNQIDKNVTVNEVLPDKNWLLQKDDIVIKRITPLFVNYVDDIEKSVFCGNNLIIVRPNEQVDAKYLAMILNEKIRDFSKESSVGSVMKSISKFDIETMSIPYPSIETQKKIGLIWYNGIELKKKKIRIAELENIKVNYSLNKAIKMLGGKENG